VVHNYAELAERAALGRCELEPANIFAVQVVPYSRIMATMAPGHPATRWLPIKWKKWWKNRVVDEFGGGTEYTAQPEVPTAPVQQMLEDPIEDE
jgi:hypothetical protein